MNINEFTMIFGDKDGRLTIEELTKSLENALEMLRSFQASVVGADIDVQWEIVRIQKRSPLSMTFAPIVRKRGRRNPAVSQKIVRTVVRGLKGLETGKDLPRAFSDAGIDATKRLVNPWARLGVPVTVVSKDGPRFKLTSNTVQQLDELSAKTRNYVDYSTIEGQLEVVSVHEHNSFFIWESLTGHKVECFVDDEQIAVVNAALLKKPRVCVSGRVHYRNHIPKVIHVEEPIRMLRTSKVLPQIKDIAPLDITGELSTEEHVQRMRNA